MCDIDDVLEKYSPYYILDENGESKQCTAVDWHEYFKFNKRYVETNKIVLKKDLKGSQLVIEGETTINEPSILIYTLFTGIESGFDKNKKPFIYESYTLNFSNNEKYDFLKDIVIKDIKESDAKKTNNKLVKTLMTLLRDKGVLNKNAFLKELNMASIHSSK